MKSFELNRFNCHRCGKTVGRRGVSNVPASHRPAPGYPAGDKGDCYGSGENPCLVLHDEPCEAVR